MWHDASTCGKDLSHIHKETCLIRMRQSSNSHLVRLFRTIRSRSSNHTHWHENELITRGMLYSRTRGVPSEIQTYKVNIVLYQGFKSMWHFVTFQNVTMSRFLFYVVHTYIYIHIYVYTYIFTRICVCTCVHIKGGRAAARATSPRAHWIGPE